MKSKPPPNSGIRGLVHQKPVTIAPSTESSSRAARPPAAFFSYVKALEHLAAGALSVSPGYASDFPVLPTLDNLRVTIPARDRKTFFAVSVGFGSAYATPPPTWRLPSICRMMRAMWMNLCDENHPCQTWPVEIESMWAAITERCHEDIGVTVLASELDITRNYLGGMFTGFMGSSFRHLLSEERVAISARQLITTNRKIETIAEDVRFSISHLNKKFVAAMGMPPKDYRRRHTRPKRVTFR